MASLDEINSEILEPMRALFRVPFGIEDPERALVEYAHVLRHHTPAILKAGWAEMVLKHKRRDWPSIFEFMEVMDPLDKAARRTAMAQSGADQIPDPWEAFCKKVLVFVKRDRRTFEAFRDAGVRAIRETNILGFDTQDLANEMREIYGKELDAAVGQVVVFGGPGKGRWEHPKWEADRAYLPN